MIAPLSLSIFTIKADRKPVMAFAAKKHTDAEAFSKDEMVRTHLDWPSRAAWPSATN